MSVHRNHVSGLAAYDPAHGRLRFSVSEAPAYSKRTPAQRFFFSFVVGLALALVLCGDVSAQVTQGSGLQLGAILGTVTDVNGDTVPQARVVLTGPAASDSRIIVTGNNGFFRFDRVKRGIGYQVVVTAEGRTEWKSAAIKIEPGQYKIISNIQLQIPTEMITVDVVYDREKAAAEQVQQAERQRVLGVIPNFYVAYDRNADPLTSKWKFKLALKTATDPVTIAGVVFISGLYQAANTPDYGQGAQGYGKRLGSVAADGSLDIMIGGAILPSLLHQDPRYFYQGGGTTRSRIMHAVSAPFVAHGDDGKLQPNFSSIGGDLATSAIANAYYPDSNRGTGQLFVNFGIATAERIGATLAQEFLLNRFTHKHNR